MSDERLDSRSTAAASAIAALLVAIALAAAMACGGAGAESGTSPAQPSCDAPDSSDSARRRANDRGRGSGKPARHGPRVARFENAEAWARRWEGHKRDVWQEPEHVVELMAIAPGMTVADIGTGTGYFLPHLSRAAGDEGHVLALDIEREMVRYVTERVDREGLGNVVARLVSVDDPALPPGAVDRVLIVNTWHHIGERVEYSRKLKRGLAAGGAVFVVDFTMESKRGPRRLSSRVTAEQAASELRAAGLTAEIVPESLSDQYVVKGSL